MFLAIVILIFSAALSMFHLRASCEGNGTFA